MFEAVNKISTKPFQSIGSHKKFYSHWKHLNGVQSLLKNFDLFNSWTKSHWFQTCSIYFLMLKENSWLKHVHVCIWMHSHQKFKSEILGFGSTEKIVHVYQYQKNPKENQSLVLSTTINKHKITLSWHLNTCISITFNENSQQYLFFNKNYWKISIISNDFSSN